MVAYILLDANIFHKNDKFITKVYQKRLSHLINLGIWKCTHFENILNKSFLWRLNKKFSNVFSKQNVSFGLIYFRFFTLFRMGFFGAVHWLGVAKKAPLPKICHTYPTMTKLGTIIPYLKKIQKLYESCGKILEFCWNQHFLLEISRFYYIKKYR